VFRRSILSFSERSSAMKSVDSHHGNAFPNAKRRILLFAMCSLAGAILGISGDLLGPMRFDLSELIGSLLLSPVLTTVGGIHVTVPWARGICLVGGLAFFPGYIVLLVLVYRDWTPWAYVGAFLWCTQGFFQLCHRAPPMMSV